MKLEFVNHSSFIVEHGSVTLLSDFWKSGMAFDDAWALLCETPFAYEDFARVTHIWFSHEHPDHFSTDNLLRIPEQLRANITILFQQTQDKRLVSFCANKGFKEVIEMPAEQAMQLGDGFEVRCGPFGSYWGEVDSWLYIKTPEASLLNINDCEMHDEAVVAELAQKCQQWGGELDLLAVQFSYASKQGNANDTAWMQRARRECLDKLALKVSGFKPAYTLPFASYVYFCHQENQYLNKGVVRVHDALTAIEPYSIPLVMFPGDCWQPSAPYDNSSALDRYEQAYLDVEQKPMADFVSSESVASDDLIQMADKFLNKMKLVASPTQIAQTLAIKHSIIRRQDQGLSKLLGALGHFIRGLFGAYEIGRLYVSDHQQAYQLTLDGLSVADWSEQECQISISSSALSYGFKFPWGGETLQVNGRFQDIDRQWMTLSQIFFLARSLDQGMQLPKFAALDFLGEKLRR